MAVTVYVPAATATERYLRPEMMCLNVLLTRQEIVERYRIPKELESELFTNLRPVFGSGESARYLESVVDQQLTLFAQRKLRLRSGNGEFSLEEEAFMPSTSPWADTVGRRDSEPEWPTERLLVDEKTAAAMLGVSRRMVFDLNKQGVLACKQIGKLKRYLVADLRAFAEGKVA